ncbi:hypothetical protein [Okeania sp. SIO1I7]|uniref:hypothetical protein n=1 Tax=Okeania sp. SIO1I7 TaxID=2607772 RepID=UPI0013FA0B85|nr:hypothetical protein [Okeania sp. SIO1I7]NET28088.1 hypothetical protein [Okeania sp. SIO1I7]
MENHKEYLLKYSHVSRLTEPQQKALDLLDNLRIPTRLYPINVDKKSNVSFAQHTLYRFIKGGEVQLYKFYQLGDCLYDPDFN